MKIKNKLLTFLTLLLFIMPSNIYAYSKEIIPGGETIGIEVNSKGVLVVGFYKVNNSYIGRSAGFEIGDQIIALNKKEITSLDNMLEEINKLNTNTVEVTIIRNNEEKNISLELVKDNDGILKTGLYVKDSIAGIGTLTYIDSNTKTFGALGHEIDEKTTSSKFNIKNGIIFGAEVIGIEKSQNGRAGEKRAKYTKSEMLGNVGENQISGIYGTYTADINENNKISVAEPNEVKQGKATIRTVIENNKKEEFEINITNVDYSSDTKNLLFEITDKRLLEKTGGIIQGMSGSPIIQNNKIIGAVTHVIVNEPTKGYGIFITTMLKEGDT